MNQLANSETKWNLPKGVLRYHVGLHIETPADDATRFLPESEQVRGLLTYGRVEKGEEGLNGEEDWPRYHWEGTVTAGELIALLNEYAIDEQKVDVNQCTIDGKDRLVRCLDFTGEYPSPFLNAVLITANPDLVGVDKATLRRVAPLYRPAQGK